MCTSARGNASKSNSPGTPSRNTWNTTCKPTPISTSAISWPGVGVTSASRTGMNIAARAPLRRLCHRSDQKLNTAPLGGAGGTWSRPELESESIMDSGQYAIRAGLRRSDRALACLAETVLDQIDALLHTWHVGIDRERTLEVFERPLQLAALHVDQAISGQRAEVMGIALHHLVAVAQRLIEIAHEVISGGALVPAFREVGTHLDDAREGIDRRPHLAIVHAADAPLQQFVHVGVAGAAPDAPHRRLRQTADARVIVEQSVEQGVGIGHLTLHAQLYCRCAPRFHIAAGQRH